MKIILKTAAVICLVSLLLCALPISASAMTIYDGDFGYEIDAYENMAIIVDYKGNDAEVVIPDSFRDYPVKKIAKSAFGGNTVVETVVIPESVKIIEQESFRKCSSLKSIVIPETVTDLGKGICIDCVGLTSATVNIKMSKLPDNTFSGCTSLNTVELSDSITQIGTSAFAKCKSLTDLSFLNNVSVLGDSSFFKNGFTDITIPENVTSLPYYSFAYSDTLVNVVILPTVTYIHPNAFSGSENIVINCYCDSYAHAFAVENRIDHKILDRQLGDVNFDGAVDVFDATEIQKFAAEKVEFSNEQFDMGDINHDGYVDVMDALLVQKSVVGKYDIPPIIIRY